MSTVQISRQLPMGHLAEDGRVTCPCKKHYCGRIDEDKTQFYCDSCKLEFQIPRPSKAYLAMRLLDLEVKSEERRSLIVGLIAALPA